MKTIKCILVKIGRRDSFCDNEGVKKDFVGKSGVLTDYRHKGGGWYRGQFAISSGSLYFYSARFRKIK